MSERDQSLSHEQETAIGLCADLSQRIVGITGRAGTGKTMVFGKAYREIASDIGRDKIVACAPTGRAAKRIHELTGIKAKTIHRLLEFPQPDDADIEGAVPNEPRRNSAYPLAERVVMVDEASMISPTLHQQLLSALPGRGCVRLFGDNAQLPPVEEGKPPFFDVLERYPSQELTWNFRSDDAIVGQALRILKGSIPIRNSQFEIIYSVNPVKELLRALDKEFAHRADYQIIMPTRKGKYGTNVVNPLIQAKFNGKGPVLLLDRFDEKGVEQPPLPIRAKDKFLWIKNDFKLDMQNGEIGYVESIDEEDGSLTLVTPDRRIIVPSRVRTYNAYAGAVINYDPRKQIEHGYAITTHKSQGSEFNTVIYCMCAGQAYLLDRRNFYTAVTRAKKKVIIITDNRAMSLAVKKSRHREY